MGNRIGYKTGAINHTQVKLVNKIRGKQEAKLT